MGQKVDPRGLRLGITRAWDSNWYADKKEYVKYFHEDVQIKEFIKKNYFHTGISKVRIERTSPSQVVVHIHTGKVGTMIELPSAYLDLDRILETGISKIVVGMNDLTSFVFATVRNSQWHDMGHISDTIQAKGIS